MKQMRMLKIILILNLLFLSACATQQTGSGADSSADTSPGDSQAAQPDSPLDGRYDNIVFYEFETTPEIKRDYPEVTDECLASAISHLLVKNVYKKVEKRSGSYHRHQTLLIKTKISDMRIVSTGARMWGGAFAGSSYMNLEVKFIDASSGSVLRTKKISSNNNAFAAAWTFGSNDRSLASDMGVILADYIVSTVPSK
ncbi:DUF4410 domain-containing protein [Allochromatium palmeri]|uniref:DUF4410 domain-containing protein n=1 Tax=Allochromatium palmeri TaxID=231048 RepID=A0A6N8EH58_9GAMM|nr:DUF4410 domain-containing protein [Allochromatium palmeri]MTW22026.1 DUF4410 domain-containing protein [Allochromatium palmeri]